MRSLSLLFLLLFMGGTAGCANRQTMRYHLAVADVESANPNLKLYRVTIHAKSSNKKSTIETGWYDARAVRELYGEVSRTSENRQHAGTLGQHRFLFDPASGRWQSVDDSQLFTVVFGTDAKAIAQTIKTFAESSETGDAFARLLAGSAGREVWVEKQKAEQIGRERLDQLNAIVKDLQAKSDAMAKLPNTTTPAEVGSELLKLAQIVVSQLGVTEPLRTDSATNGFDDAQRWLEILSQKGGLQ